MRFRYVASDPNGRLMEGYVEAKSPAEVLEWMGGQNWKPISLKAIRQTETQKFFGGLQQGGITIADQVFLTKYLALMLKVRETFCLPLCGRTSTSR